MYNDILISIIGNASPDEIEIIREKLNNHLVNSIYNQDIPEELPNDFDDSFFIIVIVITSAIYELSASFLFYLTKVYLDD